MADLAKHIGDPKRNDSLTKENVKDLAQIMGVLSTETAVALLPKFDKAMAAWKAEKTRIKGAMLKGIEPPSLLTELGSTTLFCEGLFPEKRFKELDAKYNEQYAICVFPALSKTPGNVKRKLNQQVADPTARKKSKPSAPAQAMPPPSSKLNKLRTAWGKKAPHLTYQAPPAGKGNKGNTAPNQASQPKTVQSASLKGKAAEQSNKPGTSTGSKANPAMQFHGNKGNNPKPVQPKQQGNNRQQQGNNRQQQGNNRQQQGNNRQRK